MKRFLLNILMLSLIISVMGFHFLPHILHEILGLALFLAMLWHFKLNGGWFCNLFYGKQYKIFQKILTIAFVVASLTAVVTGIIISNYVFRDLLTNVMLHRNIFIHQLHIVGAYLMVILGGIHIGIHWAALWQRIKNLPLMNKFEKNNKLRICCLTLICAAGFAFSWLDRVIDRLLMKHIFATPATQLPAAVYFLLLLCMMGFYGTISYYVIKKTKK